MVFSLFIAEPKIGFRGISNRLKKGVYCIPHAVTNKYAVTPGAVAVIVMVPPETVAFVTGTAVAIVGLTRKP